MLMLFVGTSTGSLLVYEIKEPLEKEPLSVNLLKLTKIFKKIIEQLNVILVALSANEYVLLDIGSGVLKELFSHINSGFSYMVASFSAKVNVSIFVGLDGTPIRKIDQLVKKLEYQEVISLTEQIDPLHLENKDAKLYQIRNLYARHLFRLKNFDAEMTIFQELETGPAEVIALYPSSVSNCLHHKSKINEKGCGKIDMKKKGIAAQTEDENGLIETIENEILDFKIIHHQQVYNPNEQMSLDSSSSDRIAYMMTNDASVGPLLRVYNYVNVEETEGILFDLKKYKELVDLYHGKGKHRKSLKLC
ncbi:2760_t:CDS:10 [Entrophospora sp. SA101]|nr:2760_t:CDS:10 [Entrophospora sp. SA101]